MTIRDAINNTRTKLTYVILSITTFENLYIPCVVVELNAKLSVVNMMNDSVFTSALLQDFFCTRACQKGLCKEALIRKQIIC